MKRSAIFLTLALGITAPAFAAVDLNLSTSPALEPIPGSPVYYAPDLDANYFAYKGLYWFFDGEDWYSSPGYDGPWDLVAADDVPVYLWDVPVGYYRNAPAYFHGWLGNRPPHWRQHFGPGWHHGGGQGDHGGHGGEHGGHGEHGGGGDDGGGGEHGGGHGR